MATSPTVPYRVQLANGSTIDIDNPLALPGPQAVRAIEEMLVMAEIHAPSDSVGAVMELCQRRRGAFVNLEAAEDSLVRIAYRMPLSETIVDFFAELKSLTAGYASVDFVRDGFQVADLVKVDILVDTIAVDAFAFIAHRDAAFDRSTRIITKLKHTLPRRLYPIPLQAVVEGKVIGRADLPPIRKSALAKGFEGSASAKKRLAERQRSSRTRSQGSSLSRSEIPAEVFQAILGL